MWMDTKAEAKEASRNRASLGRRVLSGLLFFTGDMEFLDKYMQDKLFALQLAVWGLRGVSRVILANNPLSGALILAALYWASPWLGLLGTLGVLASTLTAVIMEQDSVFLYSGLSPVLDRWDLPVAVFPFNIVIVLFLLCTGPDNLFFPHHPVMPPGLLEPNSTELNAVEVIRGIPLGVGQIYACETLGPSLLILGAVLLYSPLLAAHALLGSAVGTLAGLSIAVRHDSLYSGLLGFNGALGCMSVGGLFFTLSWRTHLFAIATAFLSSYADIALNNLLGTVGLPACSWASTLVVTLMLLLTGSLASYRIPMGQVMAPEHNLRSHSKWKAGNTADRESTDV
ncbi:urea transporter 1 isoform X2 [Sebastes fasciatus]|uniref:urea transporter 1 isoform X2 n=1 Tax=Sebastes fasciatus TaxID=394691 RepID=UPI003D9F3F6C